MSPSQPVVMHAQDGTLVGVVLTTARGEKLKSHLSADGRTWTLLEPLGYGKTYTVTGAAVGEDGARVPVKGSYSTVTPARQVTATITPEQGTAVGVAMPVMIQFSESMSADVRKRIAAVVHLNSVPKVDGAWSWVRHDDQQWGLDFRPKDFWPEGTKVHVDARLYGVDMGDGGYGAEDLTRDFTVGRNQVAYADRNGHQLIVKQDGKTVATYPTSMGSGDDSGDRRRVTRSGIHVVSGKDEVYKMSNPKFGYTNLTEYWDVRISSNGEFIHQNSETVGVQGVTNVSHGCLNLSAANAEQYFKSAMIGDPVVITGTSVPLSQEDGDMYDWTVPWATWQTGTAAK